MKKLFWFAAIFTIVLGVYSFTENQSANEYCNPTQMKNNMKPYLGKGFVNDGFKLTKIMYKKQPQKKEVEVPLFYGEYYKVVFEKGGLPKDIGINIYNKASTAKRRKLLFSSAEHPASDTLSFETDRADAFFVEYDIPASDSAKSGCISLIIGYLE